MANALTGDYEAVLQIATRQMSGLLGTLHQNAIQNSPVALPHSETGRIGDPRRRFPDGGVLTESTVFAEWVTTYQKSRPGRGLSDIQSQLISNAPPGAAQMLTDAFSALRATWTVPELPPIELTRGMVKLQLSPPTITVPQGSSSEVTVDTQVRARFYPDPGTTNLPAPVHGNVRAALRVRKINFPSGPKLLILPSTGDAKIQFTAAFGSGLSANDQNALSVHIRKALRESMTAAPVALPLDFPFTEFKGLGAGASQAIALPFQLSGNPAPASGVQPLSQSFIGSSGLAIAISATHITGLFDVEAIRQAIAAHSINIKVSVWPFSATLTYKLRFSSGPTLTFKPGGIEISGSVAVETNTWWAPNGSVSFKQLIRLDLDASSQSVTPMRVGDPQVNESWFIPHQAAVNTIKTHIDNVLSANTSSIRHIFSDGKNTLLKGLKSFDPYASVTYNGVEVTPDGVIVRGEIGSLPRRSPLVTITEAERSSAFTAFESWIPAGRIDRFIWSWVEHRNFSLFNGVQKSVTDEHRFIFPKPTQATQLSQICLRIEGTQTLPNGQQVSVSGGTTCSIGEFEFEMDLPAWWGPLTLPIWKPEIPETAILRDAITAHVSLNAENPSQGSLSRNALIYFCDWQAKSPLAAVSAALAEVKNSFDLMVLVVLPAGTFDAPRRKVEGKLALNSERKALLQLTEDNEAGWSRAFGVKKVPSAYIMNSRREFVWKHEDDPEAGELAAALDQHLTPPSPLRFRGLRLAVSHSDLAPDAWFEGDDREIFSLHRLRGREVLLTFWQSWSAPCLAELRRLQRLHEDGKSAPFIVGIHCGGNGNALADIRKNLGLTFALVPDPQLRVAKQYGVRCWPTTIAIGADGHVDHIQFGTAHDHPTPPTRSQVGAE